MQIMSLAFEVVSMFVLFFIDVRKLINELILIIFVFLFMCGSVGHCYCRLGRKNRRRQVLYFNKVKFFQFIWVDSRISLIDSARGDTRDLKFQA